MSIYGNSGGSGPHLAIETWLTALGVMEYQQLFAKYGGVEVSMFVVKKLELYFCLVFEPTCAHARWALMHRLLSLCLSVCPSVCPSVQDKY